MAKILIVEDDKAINYLIKTNLELLGHETSSVFDGSEVLDNLKKNPCDLIILDVMMPKRDGFWVLRNLDSEIPVIFLTALDAVEHRVKGLRLGADDYLVKPFEMVELMARVDAVLKRTLKDEKKDDFKLGEVVVSLERRQVYFKDELVDFTPQEFLLIETFIKHRNIALSRDKLLELAWGYDYFGDARTVDVHIHSIRKKLNWSEVIKTVYKLGYRFEMEKEVNLNSKRMRDEK